MIRVFISSVQAEFARERQALCEYIREDALFDGVISRHHFENAIGAITSMREITKEERLRIDAAYKEWKRNNR